MQGETKIGFEPQEAKAVTREPDKPAPKATNDEGGFLLIIFFLLLMGCCGGRR